MNKHIDKVVLLFFVPQIRVNFRVVVISRIIRMFINSCYFLYIKTPVIDWRFLFSIASFEDAFA